MDSRLETTLAALRKQYDAAYARANVSPRYTGADEKPVFALDTDGPEMTLRVQGPMDDWWGGCDVRALIAEMDEAKPKALRLLIESPGGLVGDGLALYSDLAQRKREGMALRTEAVGIVASAAVLPFLAADKADRKMAEGSLVMVHNVWAMTFVAGDADDIEREMGKTMKALKALSGSYAGIVSKATGIALNDVKAAMTAETWYSATEAVETGYAGAVMEAAAQETEEDRELAKQARAAMSQFMIERNML